MLSEPPSEKRSTHPEGQSGLFDAENIAQWSRARGGIPADDLEKLVTASEQALREVREIFHLPTGQVQQSLWDWDLSDNSCFYSPGWKTLLGYTTESLPRHVALALQLMPEDERIQITKELEVVFASDRITWSGFFRLRDINGVYRSMDCRARIFRDEYGKPYRMVGVNTDVTERKRDEEALAFGNQVVKSTLNGLIGFDTHLKVVAFNPAAEIMFGVNAEHIVGQDVFSVLPFLRDLHEDCFFVEALAGKRQTGNAKPYTNIKNGTRGFFQATYVPLSNQHGVVTGGLAVVTEITQAHRSRCLQHVLVQSGERLSQSLDKKFLAKALLELAVPALCDWSVIWLQSTEQYFVAHRNAQKELQLQRVITENPEAFSSFFAVPPPVKGNSQIASEHVARVPEALLHLVLKGHHDRDLLPSMGFHSYQRVALRINGDVLGTLTLVNATESIPDDTRSVAELVAMRGALALNNAKLLLASREASQTEGRLVEQVGREIIQPMHALVDACTRAMACLAAVDAPPPAQEALAQIYRRAADLAHLGSDAVDHSRLQRGKTGLEFTKINLVDLLQGCVDEHTARGRVVAFSPSTELLQGVWLRADPQRLRQAFGYLLALACEGADELGISCEMTVDPEEVSVILLSKGSERATCPAQSLRHILAQRLISMHGGAVVFDSMPPCSQNHGATDASFTDIRLPTEQGERPQHN